MKRRRTGGVSVSLIGRVFLHAWFLTCAVRGKKGLHYTTTSRAEEHHACLGSHACYCSLFLILFLSPSSSSLSDTTRHSKHTHIHTAEQQQSKQEKQSSWAMQAVICFLSKEEPRLVLPAQEVDQSQPKCQQAHR